MNHHSTAVVSKATWPDMWVGHPQTHPSLHVLTNLITCLPNLFLLLHSLLELITDLVTMLKTGCPLASPLPPPASFSPLSFIKWLTLLQKHLRAHRSSPPPKEGSYSSNLDFGTIPAINHMHLTISPQLPRAFFLKAGS